MDIESLGVIHDEDLLYKTVFCFSLLLFNNIHKHEVGVLDTASSVSALFLVTMKQVITNIRLKSLAYMDQLAHCYMAIVALFCPFSFILFYTKCPFEEQKETAMGN